MDICIMIYTYHTFAPLESNWKSMKRTSGKRPPDEAHGHTLLHRSAKNSAKCRQTFSYFHSLIFKISLIFRKKLSKIYEFWWKFPVICFSIFYGEDQNLSDSQIYEISQRKWLKFSENDFRKVRKTLEEVRKS